jgi:hypothetical protein
VQQFTVIPQKYHNSVLQNKFADSNYRGLVLSNTTVIYCSILTLEKVGAMVNYHGIFPTLPPGPIVMQLFTVVIYSHSMVMPLFSFIIQCGNYCGIFDSFSENKALPCQLWL